MEVSSYSFLHTEKTGQYNNDFEPVAEIKNYESGSALSGADSKIDKKESDINLQRKRKKKLLQEKKELLQAIKASSESDDDTGDDTDREPKKNKLTLHM